MELECILLQAKKGSPTVDRIARNLYKNRIIIYEYCENHSCPFNGKIDNNGSEKKGVMFAKDGYIPLSCLKGMYSQ